LREVEFVVAGRALGATDFRLLLTAILPNVWAPVLIVASFAFSQAIIVEASMSFLGVGVQPPTPTWGGMLADGREYMQLAWWPLAFPAASLAVLVLAINLLGDWLRDTLDPRIQT
jgi:peptide/nickel transport system permease protein